MNETKQRLPWQRLLMVIMILAGITVVVTMACGAIHLERKAARLSGAVIAADNVSAAFYGTGSAEAMAALLHGEAEGDTVTLRCDESGNQDAEGVLYVTAVLREEDGAGFCTVEIAFEGEILYNLDCTKARIYS